MDKLMINTDRYFDSIMEQVCEVCVQPSIAVDQNALEEICDSCPVTKVVTETLQKLAKASACTAEREVRREMGKGHKNG